MPRIIALALALAALACAAAPAAAGSVVPAGTTDARPYSDGEALVWQAPGPVLARRVPGSGRTEHVPLHAGCELQDVSRHGFALLRCSFDTLDVVETRTGRLLARLGFAGWKASAPRIGAVWVETVIFGDCYHCDRWQAINWRTGERRQVGSYAEEPVLDLDAQQPRAFSEAWQAGDGRIDVVAWGGDDVFRVYRDRRHLRTVRSDAGWETLSVSRGRVAWIEEGRRTAYATELRELRPVSGRTRRWTIGHLREVRSGGAEVLQAGRALYVAVPVRPGVNAGGPYRLLRAL